MPERQLKQYLDSQTDPNRRVREHHNATGLPSGGASRIMSLCYQIRRDPRLRSDAVWLDQFVLRSWAKRMVDRPLRVFVTAKA